jgi:hypothetical protein
MIFLWQIFIYYNHLWILNFFFSKQQSSLMENQKIEKKTQENIDFFQKIVWHHH